MTTSTPTQVRVPGFLPSQNGLHFANYYPHEPEIVVNLPFGRTLALGDAANGLCGGMVYTVCDYFEAQQPIPSATEAPAGGSDLYRFIVQRLMQSFNLPFGLNRYMELMTTLLPDSGPLSRSHAMISVEWPAIRQRLDQGHLVPLGLIKFKSTRPQDLCKQHQVLAYGYEHDGDQVALCIYDPNYPDRDDVRLTFQVSNPNGPAQVAYSPGEAVFCFFHTNYRPQPPPAAA
jgi:hypothetical protein